MIGMIIDICHRMSLVDAINVTSHRGGGVKLKPCQYPLTILPAGRRFLYAPPMTQPFTLNLPMPDGEPLAVALPSSDYPPEVVLGALAHYAETGNATSAGEALNVPRQTIDNWVNSDSGSKLCNSLRSALRFNYAHTIGRNIGISLAGMEQRLADGDMVMTKQGTLRAVPVKAKDCAVIASIMIDKYQLLVGGINEDQQSGRLEEIASRLERAASKLGGKHDAPLTLDATLSPLPTASPAGNSTPGGENNKEGNNA